MTDAFESCWRALGGDAAALASVDPGDPSPYLPSPLPVGALAGATVYAALCAGAELAETRGGSRPRVGAVPEHIAAAFRSERLLQVGDESAASGFAPLSTFLPTLDGWIRLHVNYPHHRAALLRVLGEPDGDPARVAAAVTRWLGVELEAAIVDAGGCAAFVRDESTWRTGRQGRMLANRPLLDLVAGAPGPRRLPEVAAGELPAQGVRVLDLTRVISGPVGTRMLAALGADVLRVDPPGMPELPVQAIDTGAGKRSAVLDLEDPADRDTLESLLADADVVVQGYRPGALAALGVDPEALTGRHPHIVTVTLSAWGDRGPWAYRRGFDSLVQAATGIAVATRPDGDRGSPPGVLPAQALDHGTGYLIAAAALRGLAVRQRAGRPVHATLALARTAMWLLGLPRPAEVTEHELDAKPYRVSFPTESGTVSMIGPPGTLDDRPLEWPHGPTAWGSDPPCWQIPNDHGNPRNGAKPSPK